ncbi:MAG: phytanoyl-CoA dioxygenase family protein [Rhodomicrobium sp.]|nr:phytanoyl-CoA dioxygenase family protein [Rhodomicrobium sp.]
MVTLRAHLDDCGADNGPLLIVPGSHRLGRIPVSEVEGVVKNGTKYACLAEAGDIWAYASAILHASNAAAQPTHRRVLHVDFSASELTGGLEWFGID